MNWPWKKIHSILIEDLDVRSEAPNGSDANSHRLDRVEQQRREWREMLEATGNPIADAIRGSEL